MMKTTSMIKLTPQTERVLRYLAQGYSSTQIAEKMGIATQTVNNHRHHLNLVLRIQGRNTVNIIRAALQAGLLKEKDLK